MNRALSAVAAALLILCAGESRAQTVTPFSLPATTPASGLGAAASNFLWYTAQGTVARFTGASFSTYDVKTQGTCAVGNFNYTPNNLETMGGITAGPDGNMWAVLVTESVIGRVGNDGTVARFALPGACANDGLSEIVAGSDGALWFTETNSNQIGRITTDGATINEYAVTTAGAGPKGIAAGPDGAIWFTEANRNAVGRITTAGKVTEYTTPSHPGEIAAGADGNVWYTVDTAASLGKIGRVTPQGVVTEFNLAAVGNSSVGNGIVAGPDGNIWVTESTYSLSSGGLGGLVLSGSRVIRVSPTALITEYPLSIADTNPQQIVTLGGALYFLAAGTPGYNLGGVDGNKLVKFSVPQFFPPVHIAAVNSTTQTAAQSYLRIYNTGTTPGTALLTLSDPATGTALAQYTTPVIAANSAPQFGIAAIEAAATQSFTKPANYVLTVNSQITGYAQHVLYRPIDGTLTNLSTCDRGIGIPAQSVANVHSRNVAPGFPSSLVLYNNGVAATTVGLTIYDAANGTQLGAYTTDSIAPNAEAIVAVSAIEAKLGTIPSTTLHYVVKVNSTFTGYLQHLVNNQQAGVTTDMTTVCSIGPAN